MSRVLPYNAKQWEIPLLLDGRKTVIRMVAKKIPVETHRIEPIQPFDGGNLKFECHWGGYMPDVPGFVDGVTVVKPPYQPGDTIYVWETWCWCPCWDCGMDTKEHNCCDETATKFFNHDKEEWGCYGYKASFEDNEYPSVDTWHPSIHMPKEATRIWLKVTDVRVERLQDITEEQTEAEGFEFTPPCLSQVSEDSYCDLDGPCTSKIKYCDMSAGELFGKVLWNSTIKKSDLDRYGWEANPWVWVIEFERCEKPEEVQNG